MDKQKYTQLDGCGNLAKVRANNILLTSSAHVNERTAAEQTPRRGSADRHSRGRARRRSKYSFYCNFLIIVISFWNNHHQQSRYYSASLPVCDHIRALHSRLSVYLCICPSRHRSIVSSSTILRVRESETINRDSKINMTSGHVHTRLCPLTLVLGWPIFKEVAAGPPRREEELFIIGPATPSIRPFEWQSQCPFATVRGKIYRPARDKAQKQQHLLCGWQ